MMPPGGSSVAVSAPINLQLKDFLVQNNRSQGQDVMQERPPEKRTRKFSSRQNANASRGTKPWTAPAADG
ncbi:MAG: hypothetical protein EA339_05090 [Rhodobacteraceae bacterium]|nr:MAG: hypothetical protein EA339_05090 [Paracoccaceae bacterium]